MHAGKYERKKEQARRVTDKLQLVDSDQYCYCEDATRVG